MGALLNLEGIASEENSGLRVARNVVGAKDILIAVLNLVQNKKIEISANKCNVLLQPEFKKFLIFANTK